MCAMQQLVLLAGMYGPCGLSKFPRTFGTLVSGNGGRSLPVVFTLGHGQYVSGVISLEQASAVVLETVWVCDVIAFETAHATARIAAA